MRLTTGLRKIGKQQALALGILGWLSIGDLAHDQTSSQIIEADPQQQYNFVKKLIWREYRAERSDERASLDEEYDVASVICKETDGIVPDGFISNESLLSTMITASYYAVNWRIELLRRGFPSQLLDQRITILESQMLFNELRFDNENTFVEARRLSRALNRYQKETAAKLPNTVDETWIKTNMAPLRGWGQEASGCGASRRTAIGAP